ncbi:STY4534 family ICE replication protein [Pasteurella multocida]|uniref:STY4534 family ICE replication protein n=1 Tax=Pasteurella multocida TaxID=747 RepID=UPI0029AF50D9|nr:STY4534 family ICE replication protein [Pasteurella multocida]MDX3904049.1 STY4534 family ICE replication protein [Pasteurella multocida]
MTTQTSTQKNYFNLHTTGFGYLNNIRLVEPKKGNPFYACRVSALVGESDSPEYRYFDMNVVGKETETLIKRCQKAVSEEKKVLVSFVMSDLWFDTFTYPTDSKFHKKGDTGVSLKGRLIRIKMIKIDGEIVHQEKPKADEQSE